MNKLVILLSALVMLGTSCKKSEGCGDSSALNYSPNEQVQNQNLCQYSTATFYAGSDMYTGVEIDSIEIEVSSVVIGKIYQFNKAYPQNCNENGTLQYTFSSGVEQVWFARYYLKTGGSVTQQEAINPSSSNACIRVDVTP